MWRTCPHAKAVPGVRVAFANEREIQHAVDAGALVIVVPTVRTVQEAIEARDWTFFPPLGKRSLGGGQAFDPEVWGSVPGGYRATANDNIVLILMIETRRREGSLRYRQGAGRDGGVRGERRSGQFFRLQAGRSPDYERLINVVHDAAISAGKRLCGPFAWRDRPDFTCFQGGSETGGDRARRGAELGPLKDTQGKVEVGPYATKR